MNTQNPTLIALPADRPATLTTCWEFVQTDAGQDFAKLWRLHPGDPFKESRFLVRVDSMPEVDAMAMAARILPGIEIRRSR